MLNQSSIRVLIVDDHPMVREGLAAMLSSPDIQIVGEAGSGRAALALAQALDPAVVLMDLRLPDVNGLEACRLLHEIKPDLPVLILTMEENAWQLAAAISAGEAGYLLKGVRREALLSAVRAAATGCKLWDSNFLKRIAAGADPQMFSGPGDGEPAPSVLSRRERQVLMLLASGMSNREIADNCVLSLSTVKTHIEHLLHKIAVSGRTQAAVWAAKNGYADHEGIRPTDSGPRS